MADIHTHAPLWGMWQVGEELCESSWGPIYKITRKMGGQRAYSLAACLFMPKSAGRIYDGNAKRGAQMELSDIQGLNGEQNIMRLEQFSIEEREDGKGYDILLRMEYLLSLVQYLGANAVSRKDILVLGMHTCFALKQCGGMHGDIRPGDLFLSPDGNYKLGCFPLAFQKTKRKNAEWHELRYASPEAYQGDPLQKTSDVYSLGLMLYSLLNAGQIPFLDEKGNEEKAIRKRLKGKPLPPPAAVDVRLAAVLLQATAYDPQDRYPTAGDLEMALKACLALGSPVARVRSTPAMELLRDTQQPRSRGGRVAVILVAAALLVGGGAYFFINSSGEAPAASPTPTSLPLTELFAPSPAREEEPPVPAPAEDSTPSPPPSATPAADNASTPTPAAGMPTFQPDSPIVNLYGNTTGNLVNGGIAAKQGSWVYVTDGSGKTYKRGPDAGGAQLVLTDEAAYLNLEGSALYYSNLSDGGRLYRARTDGAERVALTEHAVGYVYVENGVLYYTDADGGNALYSMRTDGSGKTRLCGDECLSINIEDGWVYYRNGSEHDSIYRITTEGTERARVIGDRSQYVAVEAGWVYYNNVGRHNYLYKVRPGGTEKKRLNNDNTAWINVQGGWVYYSSLNDQGALYKVGINGGGKQKLAEDDCVSIQVVDGWVYYRSRGDGYALYRVRTDGTEREKLG